MENADDQTMLPLEVVAAVIRDENGKVLIAKRSSEKHQGGKWEFPGGKVEKGESRRSALIREIREEIGIEIGHSSRLISVYHEYNDKAIYLDIYEVLDWTGAAEGCEGQPISWVSVDDLVNHDFPEANLPIIEAVSLPKKIKLLEESADLEGFKRSVLDSIESGHSLLFKAFDKENAGYSPDHEAINWLLDTAADHQVKVIFQSPPPLVRSDYYLHLDTDELKKHQEKPAANKVSATCSSAEDLFKAQRLGIDFLLIGPVLLNASDSKGIGWPMFQSFSSRVNMPVYAVGGMSDKDIELAREYGAQGVVL